MINAAAEKKYALVCVTSMGIRITPVDRQPVHTSDLFLMQATSAESNVLSIAASLGKPCKVLTKFVQESPISRFIQGDLRRRGLEFEGPAVPQGGAWGYRHQFNIADSGYSLRGPLAWNDRAGEVGRTICSADFDLDRIFGREGVQILHLSGLFAALSPESCRCCVEIARAAKGYGTKISFDLNYRASFWKGREEELRAAFTEIAGLADFLIGNEEDFQLTLGIQGPEAGGKDLAGKIDAFRAMSAAARAAFPNVQVFSTTLRQVISANEHLWGATMLAGDQWLVEEPRPIQIADRVGGGDGYVGGMLYGVTQGWSYADCMKFGWACGALAGSYNTDFALPISEEQVWNIYKGNARIKR